MQFLVNLYVTLSNFELLLQKFKHFIIALMLNNYSCVFWKSEENFNLEELINPMLSGYNFTENITVDVALGIYQNV